MARFNKPSLFFMIVVLMLGCTGSNSTKTNSTPEQETSGVAGSKHAHHADPPYGSVYACEIVSNFDTGNGTTHSVSKAVAGGKIATVSKNVEGDQVLSERLIKFLKHEDGKDVYLIRVTGPDGTLEKTLSFDGKTVAEFKEMNHTVSIRPFAGFDE